MAKSFDPGHEAEFDKYAQSYTDLHADSIRASGEAPEYFARYKRDVLERIVGKGAPAPVLDLGCGIGNLTQLLIGLFPAVHGYDPSVACVDLARKRIPGATFHDDLADIPKSTFGAVVVANVLHHVTPHERDALVQTAASLLLPGGKLIVFEHNPYNPLTRRAVAACPFDEGVILLPPREVRGLLRKVGLNSIKLNYIVFFPKALSPLRPAEPYLHWLPVGAQVCAWGERQL